MISPLKKEPLVAFISWISHHIMIRDHQHKDKDTKKISKEAKVLIVNHLNASIADHVRTIVKKNTRGPISIK